MRQPLALAATVVLTFVTGVVDAVGFLALDRVFTGNMTGNIVILGMGVAGAWPESSARRAAPSIWLSRPDSPSPGRSERPAPPESRQIP